MNYERSKLHDECVILAEAFKWSVRRGYDSENFIKTVMTSEWGIHVMDGTYHSEWADELFLLSGFEEFIGLSKGDCYNELEMEFIGYLYKYWVDTRHLSSVDVYKIAPPSRIVKGYSFLHTQGYEYVIELLTDDYNG
ncbi:MAG: hypothetical protein K2K06_06810 [Oscillospiraceae bacterium]|nr:hypothetical protein [Oscillospiraceae bacterium]